MVELRGVKLCISIVWLPLVICSLVEPGQCSEWRLSRNLDRVLENSGLRRALVGVMVKDLSTGRVLYSKNEDLLFIPASNEKLLTTAASLYSSGSDFKYCTQVYATGTVSSDSVLEGNLLVVGSGDPTFSETFGVDPDSVFLSWAESLKSRGVYRVAGSVVTDESLFDDERLGYGWDWHYLSYWYAAEVSALSYNDNSVRIDVVPGDSVGATASAVLSPRTSFMKLTGTVLTSNPGTGVSVKIRRTPSTNEICISGSLAVDRKMKSFRVSVSDPALFYAHRLTEILEEDSIEVGGEPFVCDSTPISATLLFSHYSPELESIIGVINRGSENLSAEMLFKTMGAREYGEGTFENGARAVKSYLASIGIDTSRCVSVDGSGLSRRNLVSPRALVKLLQVNFTGGTLTNSLPVSGSVGTLESRMGEEPLAGRVYAKTGTLDQTSALSGYVMALSGRPVVFALFVNHFVEEIGVIKSLEDDVCRALVHYSPRSSGPKGGRHRGKVR